MHGRTFQAGSAFLSRSGLHIFALLFLLLCLNGCAGRLTKATELFYADQPDAALAKLDQWDWLSRRNRLLFLMERGVVLHQLQRYRESAEQLLAAAKMIKEFDRLSVSGQVGSLVTNEWLLSYKGEYSERLWVHSYLMMDFLLLGEYDSAYVEARQALELLGRHPDALKQAYFSRALIALCFANVAEDSDAYLVYRQLADDLPSPAPVAADLVKISNRLGQLDEVARFEKFLPAQLPSGEGELVLFVASGRIPHKRPGNFVLPPSIRFSFPYYEKGSTPPVRIGLTPYFPTLPILSSDLAAVARQSLEARKLAIIAKETARVAAKEVISQKVGNQHGDVAEAVVRLSLFLLEEPDTRSWQTLPGRLTLVRVPLPAGHHKLRLSITGAGLFGPVQIDLPEIQLNTGQRLFRSLRF